MPQCGFPSDKTELLLVAHKTSCIFSPAQTRMNPLNCKLDFADPFLLFASCTHFTYVCFLHSMERTLLMDTGQLKLAACLRSSCCSTSTLHRCPQQLPAEGFLPKDSSQRDRGPGALRVRGSGKSSWLQWKTQHPLLSIKWEQFALPGKVSPPFWEGKDKPCQTLPSGPLTLLCHDWTLHMLSAQKMACPEAQPDKSLLFHFWGFVIWFWLGFFPQIFV